MAEAVVSDMQSDPKFRDCAIAVRLAGERERDEFQEYREKRLEARRSDPDSPVVGGERTNHPLRDHHLLNEDVPISGQVQLYFPDRLDKIDPDEPGAFSFAIPFRDHREHGQWFARPDAEKWRRHPVWKWENPEDDRENITLSPSYGVRPDGDWTLHCWIRDGSIELL